MKLAQKDPVIIPPKTTNPKPVPAFVFNSFDSLPTANVFIVVAAYPLVKANKETLNKEKVLLLTCYYETN